MKFLLEDNSTRRAIVLLLKKNGGMTIEDLSKSISITPMGIRQHLLALEKKAFVTYVAKKHGIGRPGFVYMLTEHADDLFPKSYDKFALELLHVLEKSDGKEKIDRIFKMRKEKTLKTRKEALSGKSTMDEVMSGLKDLLEAEGYFIDLQRNNGHYHLTQFNCPIKKIALEYHDACRHELAIYQELTGKDVVMKQSLSEGNASCLYIFPAA